jgi:anti-sigma B factor antagonist
MTSATGPAVIALPDEVTIDSVPALERQAQALLGPDGRNLVFDLGATTFMSSGGLSLIVRLGKQLADRGGSIAVARARPAVSKLLRAVGLDVMIPTFPDVAAACAHVAGKPAR